jgi:hypothetical protein
MTTGSVPTIHLDETDPVRLAERHVDAAPVCRAGNMKFRMADMRRERDIRKVNCLSCLRTALMRARKA